MFRTPTRTKSHKKCCWQWHDRSISGMRTLVEVRFEGGFRQSRETWLSIFSSSSRGMLAGKVIRTFNDGSRNCLPTVKNRHCSMSKNDVNYFAGPQSKFDQSSVMLTGAHSG